MTENHPMGSHPLVTRREMLGITGMAGLTALAGSAAGAVPQTQQTRPRIACCSMSATPKPSDFALPAQ